MADLFLYDSPIESIFQLLGTKENDISKSVAWALAKCPELLKEFISQTIQVNSFDMNNLKIEMQVRDSNDRGFTDIEISCIPYFYIIIEAKRGWNLPGEAQLRMYGIRDSFVNSPAKVKKLIAMSECSRVYAEHKLEVKDINGIEIKPVSWKDVYEYSKTAYKKGNHAEKHLLTELQNYLEGLMTMQNKQSNMVYVVSLGTGTICDKTKLRWKDIVNKKSLYFHPVGINGWPKEPPNYIAFRYEGQLKSIHHIEDYEVVDDVSKVITELPYLDWMADPHFIYKLGEGFAPQKIVKTGEITRSTRVWCMLDTLFTCDTISEARDETQKRNG